MELFGKRFCRTDFARLQISNAESDPLHLSATRIFAILLSYRISFPETSSTNLKFST